MHPYENAPVAEQPSVRAETKVLTRDRTDALRRAHTAEVEVGRGDRPLLPAPAEGDVGRHRAARDGVEAVVRVVQLGTGDRLVEIGYLAGRAVDNGSTSVDNRLESGVNDLALHSSMSYLSRGEAYMLTNLRAIFHLSIG